MQRNEGRRAAAIFEKGIAPLLSVEELQHLAQALRNDDVGLLQGLTYYGNDKFRTQGCAVVYGLIQSSESGVSPEIADERFMDVQEAFFDRYRHRASAWGEFLTWYDRAPRDEMIREMLPAVERALAARAAEAT
jgi:hypothetical protein